MQKKIIALAVAGLVSGAAFAQSNVTIYGIMDAGFYSWSGNGDRATGVQSSGLSTSRLGFKGEEALGNGLKAVFNLETTIELDSKKYLGSTNDSIFGSARQANVGLEGKFGKVLVGTQPSLSDAWAGITEPMGSISARNITGNTKGRFSNEKARGIAYYSPMFSGLQLGALYGTVVEDDRTATTGDQAYYQVGANYANGPFAASMTYANLVDDLDNSTDWTVGATYDFKVVKLYAGYERSADVGTDRDETNAQWTVGARVPVGKAGAVSASYAVNKNDVNDTDAKGWHLGYDHALSKRTTLYAAYMRLTQDDGSELIPAKRYNGTTGFAAAGGESYNGFTVGIRHLF